MSSGGDDAALAIVPGPGEATVQMPPPGHTSSVSMPGSLAQRSSTLSLNTAHDALRDEEVQRTRLFIRMGWLVSVGAIAIVPLLDAPYFMEVALIAAMTLGIVVSFGFHQWWGKPERFTDRTLGVLAIMCVINGHIAVMYYGCFTACPAIAVIGIHFMARTERERLARMLFIICSTAYVVCAAPIVIGVFPDPGVFASDRPFDRYTLSMGTLFVLGVYWLAYVTARAFREASIRSIEQLQKQTRLASQRQALLEELRVDLERALRIGSPGRHTDQVVGDLKLGVLLGRGAMGEVYEATNRTTGEAAAVKLLRRELLADPTHVARFLREVRASVDSPHVVKVIEASTSDAALPYLAMERLRGTTLAEILRKDPRLSMSQVVELVTHIAEGIDAAGRAGIVHRDLKPQNLFRHGDVWKILDFGVATLAEENTGTLTQGGIVGTPHYMAPEQAQAKRVDARADLYALAAIAYRCLTGRHAFSAADTPAILFAVVHEMPLRPGDGLDVHPDVDRWFAIALAKSPDARFATGEAMTAALRAAVPGNLDLQLRRRADALLDAKGWST